MNASTYTAQRLAAQQAAQLTRDSEIIRSHAARHAATGRPARPSALATFMARFTKFSRLAPHRNAVSAVSAISSVSAVSAG